jgi:O-antigen/teichoic acid export membrane protein
MGLSYLLVSLSPIILLPFLTNNLSTENFGVWVQFTITVNIIPAVAILGLPYSFVRYMSISKNQEEIQEAFYTISFVIAIFTMGLSLVLFLFAEPISRFLLNGNVGVALVLPVTIFFTALILVFFDFFRTFQRTRLYNFFYLFQAYLMVFLTATLVINGFGVLGAVTGYLLAQIIIFSLMLSIIIKNIGFTLPRFVNLEEYLHFGIPNVPSHISTWILDASDRYVIGFLLGLTAVGFYSGGYTVGSLIMVLLSPFYILLLPILSKYYLENDISSIQRFMNHSIKLFLAVAIPLTFILTFLSEPLLIILSTPEIAANSFFLVPIVAVGGIFYGLYGIVTQIIILIKRTKLTGNIWIIITLLNLILDVFLGYRYGIAGIAFTSMLMFMIAFLATSHYAFKVINCTFYYSFIIKAVLSSCAIGLVLWFINPHGTLNVVLALIYSPILYLTIMLLVKGIKVYEILILVEIFKDLIYYENLKALIRN